MTVSNEASSVTVSGNGAQTVFTYGFEVPSVGGYNLYLVNSLSNATLLAQSTYTVSGIGNATGGTFTYPVSGSPLAAGNTLVFVRATPNQQTTTLANQGAYYPQSVEAALDYLVFQLQELARQVGNALQASPADTALPNPLPMAALRANLFLAFDASGNPIASAGGPGGTSISAPMVPVVQAASLAVARTTLGAAASGVNSDITGLTALVSLALSGAGSPIALANIGGNSTLTLGTSATIAAPAAGGAVSVTAGGLTSTFNTDGTLTLHTGGLSGNEAVSYAQLTGYQGSAALAYSVANASVATQAAAFGQVVGGAAVHGVTGSRVLGTTYTNSQPDAMLVEVSVVGTGGGTIFGYVNGNAVQASTFASGFYANISMGVPPGSTYEVVAGSSNLNTWNEVY